MVADYFSTAVMDFSDVTLHRMVENNEARNTAECIQIFFITPFHLVCFLTFGYDKVLVCAHVEV